jgi:hypothetical protein
MKASATAAVRKRREEEEGGVEGPAGYVVGYVEEGVVALAVPMKASATAVVRKRREWEEGGVEGPAGYVVAMKRQRERGEEEPVLTAKESPLKMGAEERCYRRERTGAGLLLNTATRGSLRGASKT